ncbi:MAG: gamma-glutamyltransferase, partial [Candidatus Rokuibacteriota bacterium]
MIRSRLMVTKQTPRAPRGLVTAEHPLGAEAGARILRAGGNAVDAAVATAFAMTVVEPFMSTVGGSGTMLVHLARRGMTMALDFNGSAPLRAHATMFPLTTGRSTALFAWRRVQDDANVYGPLSVAVPGSVAGLTYAVEHWGTMELADVLAPAIELAREGFVPDWYLALTTAKYIEELCAFPDSARTYLRNGHAIHRPPTAEYEDRAVYPDLARSLELISREGADAFYKGAIADAIEAHMKQTGGLITKNDLAAYRVRVSQPLTSRYRDLDVAWSPGATGGISALQILSTLGQFPSDRVGWG